MEFSAPLIPGVLVRRYKRFLSDVRLADGTIVVAHCANSGSMFSVDTPGSEVWLSEANNPERKLRYTWELLRVGKAMVGINTNRPNALVEEAIRAGSIPELSGYETLRREVRYGRNSRIDILLESDGQPPCYVEVKNVTLCRAPPRSGRSGRAEFPDAVTVRGAKHLGELTDMVAAGARSVMIYLVQRPDCASFAIAEDIDPSYAEALRAAQAAGVEVLCYGCKVSPRDIQIAGRIPFTSGHLPGQTPAAKHGQRKR